jgi:hypothetical protein
MSSLSADLSAKNSMIISMERKLLDEVESLQAAQVKVFALEKEVECLDDIAFFN